MSGGALQGRERRRSPSPEGSQKAGVLSGPDSDVDEIEAGVQGLLKKGLFRGAVSREAPPSAADRRVATRVAPWNAARRAEKPGASASMSSRTSTWSTPPRAVRIRELPPSRPEPAIRRSASFQPSEPNEKPLRPEGVETLSRGLSRPPELFPVRGFGAETAGSISVVTVPVKSQHEAGIETRRGSAVKPCGRHRTPWGVSSRRTPRAASFVADRVGLP